MFSGYFEQNTLKQNLTYSCFIFPLFHEQIKHKEKWANKSSTNQDKIATVPRTYVNDWKNILPLCKL